MRLTLKGVGVLGTKETFLFGVVSISLLSFDLKCDGRFGVFSLSSNGYVLFLGDPLRVRCRGVDDDKGAFRNREGEKGAIEPGNGVKVLKVFYYFEPKPEKCTHFRGLLRGVALVGV